jgi:hypothetical protein
MSSTVDRQAFAVRLTGYEVSEEAVMPIRIRSRDTLLDCTQPAENKEMSAPQGGAPKV